MSGKHSALSKYVGKPRNQDEQFNHTYLLLKIRLGLLETSQDPFSLQPAEESLSETLASFAGVALKYLGNGLFSLGERTFEIIRNQTEHVFLSYPSMVTNWKSRVWKHARDINGRTFDGYKVNVVPHADMIKRIQAVEAIHKALENVAKIYNAPVSKTDDSWTTPDCEKAITAMERIGYQARNYDFLNAVSKTYAKARKNQPIYLHGYTPKRILDLLVRCEKLAQYGDQKYITKFEADYLKCTDDLEAFEVATLEKSAPADADDAAIEKVDKATMERDHESKIRAARLWWLAHFLKAAYAVTSDILKDMQALANVTERSVQKTED